MGRNIDNVFKKKSLPRESRLQEIEQNKGVSRVEYSTNSGAWYVRIRHKGKDYPKSFSDRKCGGRYSALLSAIAWRNDKEKEFGLPRTDGRVVGMATSNTGVAGLNYHKDKDAYQVTFVDCHGRRGSSSMVVGDSDPERVIEELLHIKNYHDNQRFNNNLDHSVTIPTNTFTKTSLISSYSSTDIELGVTLYCESRKREVVVTGISKGAITHPTHKLGLILCGDLAKAVKKESLSAICHWWGVKPTSVRTWRSALSVPRCTEGTRRLLRKHQVK